MKKTVRDVTDRVKHGASDAAHKVQEQASSAVDDRKTMAAETLDSLADAFRDTARNFEDQDQIGVSRLIEQAADRVSGLSDYLRERDLRDMIGSIESSARRHPALFLGGAFVAGLLIARFLKSSREKQYEERSNAGNSGGNYGQSGYSAGPRGPMTGSTYGQPGMGQSGLASEGYGSRISGTGAQDFGDYRSGPTSAPQSTTRMSPGGPGSTTPGMTPPGGYGDTP